MGPTLALLKSNTELSAVVLSLDNESETIEVEDINEFVFNKIHLQSINAHTRSQSFFIFYNKSFGEIHLERIFPPPDYI